MALKTYEWRGGIFQFEEKVAPKDAVLIGQKQRVETKNKSRAVKGKASATPAGSGGNDGQVGEPAATHRTARSSKKQ